MNNDTIWIGFAVGAILPVLGYLAITEIFGLLTTMGIMDHVSMSTGGQRSRTTLLLAIAVNILPTQYYVKKRSNYAIRGVVLATLIYAGFWLYRYFHLVMEF